MIVAGQAAQLRTVLRLRDDCTFVVDVTDRDGERSAVLSCPGGVAIELDSSGVVDRLAAAVIEAGELFGQRPEPVASTGKLSGPRPLRAEILTATETAALLGVKRATLVDWQRTAWGPAPIEADGVLKFRRSEVLAWLRRSAS